VLLARQAADLIEYSQSHALRQSAERMRRAISVETVGTVFFNVQGRVNAANDTFLRMSRYSRQGVGAGGNALA
jgi:PAS domain-containing protein